MSKKTLSIIVWSPVGIFWTIIAILVIIGIIFLVNDSNKPGQLDDFATCLKDKGAIFYGAFWCQHCKNQKTMFGNSARLLPYVECSLPDGKGQNQTCNDKKVESYPTWEFADKSRETGEVPLKTLAEKTGCVLPQNY